MAVSEYENDNKIIYKATKVILMTKIKYISFILLLCTTTITRSYAATFPYGQYTNPDITITNHNTLRVVNQCSYPIWVHTEGRINGAFQQANLKLGHGSALDYMIPETGAIATLTKASAGCDETGKQCAIGSADVDTRFEVDWNSIAKGHWVVPNLSAVEGYTFPVKVEYIEKGFKKVQDCGQLSLAQCPSDFRDYKNNNGSPVTFDQRVFYKGQIVGCYSNKKLNPGSRNYDQFVKNNDYTYYGCPNNDFAQCRSNYGFDASGSNIINDSLTPAFVQYLHHYGKYQGLLDESCKMYAYAYDDTFGTPTADADQPITLTYCPDPRNEPVLPD